MVPAVPYTLIAKSDRGVAGALMIIGNTSTNYLMGAKMTTSTNEIWEEFSQALKGFILKRVRDTHAAQDILQDTFYNIQKNIKQLKDPKKLQAWLYQITRNAIIDYYRSHKVPLDSAVILEDLTSKPDSSADVNRELSPCTRALIERLPDKYVEPIVLTELDGLTQKQMAQKLGLSISGAKSRVQRARAMLKDKLEQCCHFQFDRRGNIREYQPKSPDAPECCDDKPCQ